MTPLILGGSSRPGQITVYSQNLKAIARSDKQGCITCRIEVHTRSLFRLLRGNLVIATLCILVAAGWYLVGLIPEYHDFQRYYWLTFAVLINVPALLYSRWFLAPWHGAEHMAITAHRRSASTDLAQIQKESPISETCGGRFVAALWLFLLLIGLSDAVLGVGNISAMVLLIAWLVIPIRSLDVIPGSLSFSFFLQKHFTTRQPGKQELLTAQAAVQCLVEAEAILEALMQRKRANLG